MGKLHRLRRSRRKAAMRAAGSDPKRDRGYRETDYGELRSTIRKLTELEIIERLCEKAADEIRRAEDERVIAEIGRAIDAFTVKDVMTR